MKAFSLLLLLYVTLSSAFPVAPEAEDEGKTLELVETYLQNFYNLQRDHQPHLRNKGENPLAAKLKEMQAFFGLQVTGKPDLRTLEIMKKPRCGIPDIGEYVFTKGNPKWKSNHLTYRILNYTPKMRQADTEEAIKKALSVWSKVTPLTFRRVEDEEADIVISFAYRDHRDNSPFDGPNGQLAHAFQPGEGIGGDVHLDEEEAWTKDGRGYNLFIVVAHELGHSLGLSHSTDPGALMYPAYSYTDPNEFLLPQDDIDGIQAIYGKSNAAVQPTGPVTPEACDPNLTFDAIATLRGEIIFFKDRYMLRKHPARTVTERNFISLFWSKLPSGIQAAYENIETDEVLVFKEDKYWVIRGYDIAPGYPKPIYHLGFPKTVKRVNAAYSDENTGKTYFFIADRYWRYDENKKSMDHGYPRKIVSDFGKIGRVDAAFQKDGYVYFFHGTTQFQFDPHTKRIVRQMKSISWFNC
ncbi:PREDICTED: interstitial collagenase-like [Chaetura pelagica]|uniref:interstitial collagenase-like n=1 Tax=Chaetura pelagica TaxID=8897 RepID=UPI00052341B0|nr:PREDICTED: interstitial collagenase-like [Chaetura pelagica]